MNTSVFVLLDRRKCQPASDKPASATPYRYVKLFRVVDLTTDFFFSYTYDLTSTLQYNCTMYTKAQHDLAERIQAQRDAQTAGVRTAALLFIIVKGSFVQFL